jgi:hypothetical protein
MVQLPKDLPPLDPKLVERHLRVVRVTVRELVLGGIAALELVGLMVLGLLYAQSAARLAESHKAEEFQRLYERSLRTEVRVHNQLGRNCAANVMQLAKELGILRNMELTSYGAIYGVGGVLDSATDPALR